MAHSAMQFFMFWKGLLGANLVPEHQLNMNAMNMSRYGKKHTVLLTLCEGITPRKGLVMWRFEVSPLLN